MNRNKIVPSYPQTRPKPKSVPPRRVVFRGTGGPNTGTRSGNPHAGKGNPHGHGKR